MSTSDVDGICEHLDGCKLGKISDEELFKQPPPLHGDCPICSLRMPSLRTGWRYQSCCGKVICSGCSYAPVYDDQGNEVIKKCPFCRTPKFKSNEDYVIRMNKRVEANDPNAMQGMSCFYRNGECGLPQDYTKALELLRRAAELGYSAAYNDIGYAYDHGKGVEVDKKKAEHYYQLAAIGGCVISRYNLGLIEWKAGNKDRAFKHSMIAVQSGKSECLNQIKWLYSKGLATKEDYTKALRSYQEYLGEIKSSQRDKAAAFNSEKYRYY